MKKLIVLYILFFSIHSFSQNTDYLYAKDISKARELTDFIASHFRDTIQFSYTKEIKIGSDKAQEFIYQNRDSSIQKQFLFSVRYVGRNPELEIKGTPEYYLFGLTGKFIDIFSFWKAIDPSANQDEIIKERESQFLNYEIGGQKKKIHLVKDKDSENRWSIEVFDRIY